TIVQSRWPACSLQLFVDETLYLDRAWPCISKKELQHGKYQPSRFSGYGRGFRRGSRLGSLVLGTLENFLARTSRPFFRRGGIRRSRQQQRLAMDSARPAA